MQERPSSSDGDPARSGPPADRPARSGPRAALASRLLADLAADTLTMVEEFGRGRVLEITSVSVTPPALFRRRFRVEARPGRILWLLRRPDPRDPGDQGLAIYEHGEFVSFCDAANTPGMWRTERRPSRQSRQDDAVRERLNAMTARSRCVVAAGQIVIRRAHADPPRSSQDGFYAVPAEFFLDPCADRLRYGHADSSTDARDWVAAQIDR